MSEKLNCRTVPRKITNHVLQRNKNRNAPARKKDAKNEVTYDVTNYFNSFNIFDCGRKFLDRLDVSYERACMAIQSAISDSTIFDSEEQVDAKRKFGGTG